MIRKTCQRKNDPGHAHEPTFSCYRRLPLLSRDRTRLWLIDAIDKARNETPFRLWAYVIMPEHAHLLISPREDRYDVSEILWRIKRPVARNAFYFLEKHAPHWLEKLTVRQPDATSVRRFWQAGGGYDRNIVQAQTTRSVVDYLHANPVKRGLVGRPDEWEWSSARWYEGIRPVPLEMDEGLPRIYEL
ncbi:REP-associated tyrosine transposase [Singulisphaera rosea]